MTMPDDLSNLFAAAPVGPSQELRYRQGVVLTWNTQTAANTVLVGGQIMTDLPVLNTTEALLLSPGAVVAIMIIGSEDGSRTMAILGRLTIPGTPQAASTLQALTIGASFDTTNGVTSTNGYVDLDAPGTVGPSVTVTVGVAGRVRVTLSAQMQATPTGNVGAKCAMSFEASGANAIAASNASALVFYQQISNVSDPIDFNNYICRASYVHFLSGLAPGVTEFVAKYSSGSSATAANFADRLLIVEPL